tara:strand:+ start:5446 stop:5625 length:180 start_codon:yes stop_codon:yes gene_type:complete
MNLEQRVEALEQKLDAFFANEYPRVRNIVDKREEERKEEPLVILGQGEYRMKIYPSDIK